MLIGERPRSPLEQTTIWSAVWLDAVSFLSHKCVHEKRWLTFFSLQDSGVAASVSILGSASMHLRRVHFTIVLWQSRIYFFAWFFFPEPGSTTRFLGQITAICNAVFGWNCKTLAVQRNWICFSSVSIRSDLLASPNWAPLLDFLTHLSFRNDYSRRVPGYIQWSDALLECYTNHRILGKTETYWINAQGKYTFIEVALQSRHSMCQVKSSYKLVRIQSVDITPYGGPIILTTKSKWYENNQMILHNYD